RRRARCYRGRARLPGSSREGEAAWPGEPAQRPGWAATAASFAEPRRQRMSVLDKPGFGSKAGRLGGPARAGRGADAPFTRRVAVRAAALGLPGAVLAACSGQSAGQAPAANKPPVTLNYLS